MTDPITESTVQDALVARLTQPDLGWTFVDPDELPRELEDVILESEVVAALKRLNPEIASHPERVDEVIPQIRATLLSVTNDGLIATNEQMTEWLCGRKTVSYTGETDFLPVRLIDFDNPRANSLIVSTEVVYPTVKGGRRYDLVLYVNGFPLVVGETKTPISSSISWLNGATDIHDGYEKKTPAFFVPNVLSFATEGKELHYGAIGQPPEQWLPWGKTTDDIMLPGLPSALRSAELLLAPELLLDILRTYTLFMRKGTKAGGHLYKVIPRYPQVEAVEAIVARARDITKRQGLVKHHQGSGKTFVGAFAAAKLRQEMDLDAPTILVVVDRIQLITQVTAEYLAAGIPSLKVAKTRDELRQMLKDDARGVIITTVFRFKDAGLLNDRRNIVVIVDEAHRTQEGRLGLDMREALPNAKFFGLTGTPISTADKNTWDLFGDPDDPEGLLNLYTPERSIADGATVPIHVDTRLVEFQIDHEALEDAFAALAEEARLDEDEAGALAARASRADQFMKNPERIRAVCANIVEHYRSTIAPLGLKAQVVAFDRELCVLYHEAITELLEVGEEATVVMSTAKDDPVEWDIWNVDREQEEAIKQRFEDVDDPLKFIIVTAKLLTGFDAPIEGVMYLDKPLRAHTLFQAVCRTNRRWTNPHTSQEKFYGLVVDYVGLGTELAKAVAVKDTAKKKSLPADVSELIGMVGDAVAVCLNRFTEVDRKASGVEQLQAAQAQLKDQESRDAFAAEFLEVENLFEFLWPDTGLKPYEVDYNWLARIYKSVAPTGTRDELLWKRLGAKTNALIQDNLSGVTIDDSSLETVAIDADVFEKIRDLELFPDDPAKPVPPTIEEVMSTLEKRLERKLAGSPESKVWRTLSERLEDLRRSKIETAAASVEFLKLLLKLATDVVEAERADAEGRLDEFEVLDPDRGALTQILEEYAPDATPYMIERVVEEIDDIVRPVRGTGWQQSHPGDREVRREIRLVLKSQGLPTSGDLFDRAYAYVREHY